jgi:hypothetical protein
MYNKVNALSALFVCVFILDILVNEAIPRLFKWSFLYFNRKSFYEVTRYNIRREDAFQSSPYKICVGNKWTSSPLK